MNISSSRNEKVKYARKLARRRYRRREGRFLIEGPRLLAEAVTSGAALHSVFTCPELLNGEWSTLLATLPAGVPVHDLPAAVFRSLAVTDAPQGIMAVVEMRRWEWADCLRPSLTGDGAPLVVMVDGLRDPGNLGTIVRTAEALGAGGVILGEGTADPWNPKAVRATMGAVFRQPLAVEVSLARVIPSLKERGLQILVAAARTSTPLYQIDWRPPTAVVLGNEVTGVSPEVLAQADGLVNIPMPGRSESLNAGMAAGILLYEVLRQRSAG